MFVYVIDVVECFFVEVEQLFVCFLVCCVFCVGCNYVDYVCEMGVDFDCELLFFFIKFVDVIVLVSGMVVYLLLMSDFYYEIELVVVIGKDGWLIDLVDVLLYVWGYGVGVDFMCCDLQVEVKKLSWLWDWVKGFDVLGFVIVLCVVMVIGYLVVGCIWFVVNGDMCQ